MPNVHTTPELSASDVLGIVANIKPPRALVGESQNPMTTCLGCDKNEVATGYLCEECQGKTNPRGVTFESKPLKTRVPAKDATVDSMVQRVIEALSNQKKPVDGASILVMGLSTKRNFAAFRKSPSRFIVNRLEGLHANVSYQGKYAPYTSYEGTDYENFDLVIIAVLHSYFDFDLVRQKAPLILDTVGVYQPTDSKVIRL